MSIRKSLFDDNVVVDRISPLHIGSCSDHTNALEYWFRRVSSRGPAEVGKLGIFDFFLVDHGGDD